MGKLFNDLAYGQYVNTYAGLPIEQTKQTADVLEAKYWENKDAIDKATIAIANMDLHKQDETKRQDAQNTLTTTVKSIVDGGNYEHGSLIVRKAATELATNRGLIEALKSRQGQLAQDATLNARVGKPENENGILPEDYAYEKDKAEKAYKGVYQDANGVWVGHYNIGDVPKYINIGKRTDEFLKSFKPDTYIGRQMVAEPDRDKDGGIVKDKQGNTVYQPLISRSITKTNDGRYVWVEERETEDGSYVYYNTTEEAPYEQVYQAARNYIMQDAEAQARIEYDAKKDISTFTDRTKYESANDARAAIIDDLITYGGYNEENLKNLANDKLYDIHKREAVVNQGIVGPVIAASYVKESQHTFGMTFAAKKQLQKTRNAKDRGGDDKTPDNNHIIFQTLTQGYSGVSKPNSIQDYQIAVRTAQTELDKHNVTIDGYTKEIKAIEDRGGKVPEALTAKYEKALTDREKFANTISELNNWFNYSASEVRKEIGDDAFSAYEKELVPRIGILNDEFSKLINELPDEFTYIPYSAFFISDEGRNIKKEEIRQLYSSLLSNGMISTKYDNSWFSTISGVSSTNPTQALITLLESATTNIKDPNKRNIVSNQIGQFSNTVNTFKESYDKHGEVAKKVSDKMNERALERTTNYAYVDISTPAENTGNTLDAEKVSNFTSRATALFRNNPNAFTLINTDGKEVLWENNNDNTYYNKEKVKVLGMTTQPVGNHGYCVVAIEDEVDDKGTKTGKQKQHIFKPGTLNTELLALAKQELQYGTLSTNNRPSTGIFFDHTNQIIAVWEKEDIDRQLSVFQDYPELPPTKAEVDKGKRENELVREVYAGATYKGLVKRRTNVKGESVYDVTYINRVTGEMYTVQNYPNLFEVEMELERAVNNGAYNVPLSTLKKIHQQDLTRGTLSKNVVAQYLHDSMYKQVQAFEALMPPRYEIRGLLESNYSNITDNKQLDKQPLEGRALSITYTDELFNWLKAHTDKNGMLENTKLKYTIAGTNKNRTINLIYGLPYEVETYNFGENHNFKN